MHWVGLEKGCVKMQPTKTEEYVPTNRPKDLGPKEFYCRHCGAIWKASRICHCVACHQTFTGFEGFDQHQVSVCDACTVDDPCQYGKHPQPWRTACRETPVGGARMAADADGRYRCAAPNVGLLGGHTGDADERPKNEVSSPTEEGVANAN